MKKVLTLLVVSILFFSCQEDDATTPELEPAQQTFSLALPQGQTVDSVVVLLKLGQEQKRLKLVVQGATAAGAFDKLGEGEWQTSLLVFLTSSNTCAQKVLKLDNHLTTIYKQPTPVNFPTTGGGNWQEFYYHQINDAALQLKNLEVFAPVDPCGLFIEVHFNGNPLADWAFNDRVYWKDVNGELEQVSDYKWGETMGGIDTNILRMSISGADNGDCKNPDWTEADSYLILNYGGTEKELKFCWTK